MVRRVPVRRGRSWAGCAAAAVAGSLPLALLGVAACSGPRSAASLAPGAAARPSPAPATSFPVQRICAGQCGPPYLLDVYFRRGTSRQAARNALKPCAADPVVIRIGPAGTMGGQLTVALDNRVIGIGPRSDGLLACLHRASLVTGE